MTDEPLGSHVLELEVVDVIEETADSRSLVFRPAARRSRNPRRQTALRPRPVPDTAGAQRPNGFGGPLLLAVQFAVHRRCVDGHGQAHRRRLRVQLAVRQRAPRHEDARPCAVGHVRPQDPRHRLPVAGRGQRHHPDDGDLKSALAEGSGKVTLVYANRDENSVIFAEALRELAAKYPDRLTVVHWLESVQGLPSATALAELVAPFTGREAFICGPVRSWPPPRRR